jgi:hypothetical protein
MFVTNYFFECPNKEHISILLLFLRIMCVNKRCNNIFVGPTIKKWLLDFWKISATLSWSTEVSQPQAGVINIYMVQNVVLFIIVS